MQLARVRHDVSADPSSTALILAGPLAAELWPADDFTIDVSPPVRMSTGYAAALRVLRGDVEVAHGTVLIGAGSIAVECRADDEVERDVRKALARYLRRLDNAAKSATSAA